MRIGDASKGDSTGAHDGDVGMDLGESLHGEWSDHHAQARVNDAIAYHQITLCLQRRSRFSTWRRWRSRAAGFIGRCWWSDRMGSACRSTIALSFGGVGLDCACVADDSTGGIF